MADKNIISKNPFGININLPQKSMKEVAKVAKQEIQEIAVNPFLNYLDANDKVFSGEVANEIKKYQSQIYTMGQAAREHLPVRTFKMNM